MSHRCIREAIYEYTCDGVGCSSVLREAQPADHGWGHASIKVKRFSVDADLCPACADVVAATLRQVSDEG